MKSTKEVEEVEGAKEIQSGMEVPAESICEESSN